MRNDMLYMKENVYFEPLFNHWYAWPYLLPPVTAARHMINTHSRIMKSFVNNYKLHILAGKESILTGGEFLNCTREQVSDIRALIAELEEKCSDLIRLSEAVKELDELVFSHTSGKSIECLYQYVPDPLKGYVELVLDMEHRASYRLIEPLLYQSQYYRSDLQSVSFGLLEKVKERPFVFSTPRLPDENHLQIDIQFNSPMLDALFETREIPKYTEEIVSLFEKNNMQGGIHFRDLFTKTEPKYLHTPVRTGVRLRYTGHAGFLIETENVSILIDPVIANRNERNDEKIFSYSDLPSKIDYICLTHNHQDHLNLETLLQLRYKTQNVVVPKNNGGSLADPSIRLLLKQLNFSVIEVDDLEEIAIPGGRVVSIPFLGEHGDLNIRSKTAWYIEVHGKKCFFGADSSNPDIHLYQHLGKLFNDIDVLAIGMECVGAPYTWLYGALHTKPVSKTIKETRRLNGSDSEQAFAMVGAFNARTVYVYALGMEPWFKYFMGIEYGDSSKQVIESNKLVEACKEINVRAEVLYGKKTIMLE